MPFDGDETVGVTERVILGFILGLVLFLLADVSPNLIALNVLDRNIHNQTARQLRALLTSVYQEPQDRCLCAGQ